MLLAVLDVISPRHAGRAACCDAFWVCCMGANSNSVTAGALFAKLLSANSLQLSCISDRAEPLPGIVKDAMSKRDGVGISDME
jgi:hypothetical protein